MKYVIKVNTIPFDYWHSMTCYEVDDWFQFITPKWKSFPLKVVERKHEISDNKVIYKYKLG